MAKDVCSSSELGRNVFRVPGKGQAKRPNKVFSPVKTSSQPSLPKPLHVIIWNSYLHCSVNGCFLPQRGSQHVDLGGRGWVRLRVFLMTYSIISSLFWRRVFYSAVWFCRLGGAGGVLLIVMGRQLKELGLSVSISKPTWKNLPKAIFTYRW